MVWRAFRFRSGALFATDGRAVRTWLPETGRWHVADMSASDLLNPAPGADDPGMPVDDVSRWLAESPPTGQYWLAMFADDGLTSGELGL